MKPNYYLQTIAMLFFVITGTAQQGINYKAIINDDNGDALVNTTVTVQFTILENGTTNVFQETHNPTTDANGILIVNIGEGTIISGDFNAIDWGSNPHYLKTEINTGDGLIDMGTTEFKAVPYSIHAETANMAIMDEVDDADADPVNELQSLMLVDRTLSLSNGGSVELPSGTSTSGQYYFADKDGDGFGYMYEPLWVLDGVDPPAFYVSNSNDCNDYDYYTQDGSPEICDGVDNNCDGQFDENLIAPDAIIQEGVCYGAKQVCDGANGWIEPNYSSIIGYEYTEITCDGLDNDCDGLVDEEIYPPDAVNQNGVCYGAKQVCDGANGWLEPDYTTIVNYENTETTCDGLDNDCDGQVDDGFRDENGIYISDVACGNCYTNCQEIYNVPNAYGICNPSVPGCEMICEQGWADMNGNPQNGCEFYLDEDAVYVSPYGEDISGCGTTISGVTLNACKSITYSIGRALSEGRENVLVANGLYKETVSIYDGINLLGGFDPFSWNRDLQNPNTVLEGVDYIGDHSVTIRAEDISQPTTISGFKIYGAINNNPIGNSYAIYIKDCNGDLVFENNVIIGGVTGDGVDGPTGGNGNDGTSGQDGFDARLLTNSDDRNQGGEGGNMTVGGDNLSGGDGGTSVAPRYNDQAMWGEHGEDTPFLGGGQGGPGGHDRYTNDGYSFVTGGFLPNGEDGEDGLTGHNGGGGPASNDPNGAVINGHWKGSSGGDGSKGDEGSGGGGGGAAGGADDMTTSDDVLGASGGGGGSGAAGGGGGSGGSSAGGSFCIFIVNSTAPEILNNTFYLGSPSRGGNGGNGGFKGIGGSGGMGGTIPEGILWYWAIGLAGDGGNGGDGGHGGGGAGGTGGGAFGIYGFNVSGTTNYETTNQFSGGVSGKGGSGGLSLGNEGESGADGIVVNTSIQ